MRMGLSSPCCCSAQLLSKSMSAAESFETALADMVLCPQGLRIRHTA